MVDKRGLLTENVPFDKLRIDRAGKAAGRSHFGIGNN